MITIEESNKNKEKCKELREIRVRLAKDLNISHLISKESCTYNGLCNGTCPRCEYEERMLLDEIYNKNKNKNIISNNPINVYPPIKTPGLIIPPKKDIPLSGKVVQKPTDSKFDEFLSKTNFFKDKDNDEK